MRQQFLDGGVLTKHTDRLTFREDVELSSPSGAAAVIHTAKPIGSQHEKALLEKR